MQAAASRARKSLLEAVAAPAPVPVPRLNRAEKEFADARQDYLDALPIAAFLVCLDEEGRAYIDIANDRFRALAGWSERTDGKWVDAIPFLDASAIGTTVAAFLAGDEPCLQFESDDGQSVGGRHFD